MTTIQGLFAAGDGVGASSHKFSSGSFTEGRIAAKAAVMFVRDHSSAPEAEADEIEAIETSGLMPLTIFERYSIASSSEHLNPNFLFPDQALPRLQKIMDEYAAGASSGYQTNEHQLLRAQELLNVFESNLQFLAARDWHDLLRCAELVDRFWCASAHIRHMLFRKETRWPGFYVRSDYSKLDNQDWQVFVNSVFAQASNKWHVWKAPSLK